MSKSILEKIYDKIDKLEKDKQDYLEVGKMTTVNKKEEEIEEIKRLLFQDRLTQYGKRKLVQHLEQKESISDKVTDKLKELERELKNDGYDYYSNEIKKILNII